MVMTDESWHVVRNITGVTGFVGPGSKPVPLSDEEVVNMGVESKVYELKYSVGDTVRIISGTLTGFVGVVKEISDDKKKIKVLASMFGRETPVELDSDSVELLEV
jgi:transcriptional antiterminator NusG